MSTEIKLRLVGINTRNKPAAAAVFEAAAEALTADNQLYLDDHPDVPQLYEAGVEYREEKPGDEHWRGIAEVWRDGHGDCEDLACWRAAELRHQGIDARVRVTPYPDPVMGDNWTLWHFWVEITEPTSSRMQKDDPAARLGML